MRALFASLLALGLAAWAWAGPLPGHDEMGVSEGELAEGVRSGRIGREELVQRGRSLSYFTRLKLYYYAQELEPYFLGLEDAFRDLARADPQKPEELQKNTEMVALAMSRCRSRLMNADREDAESEWRRGLVGLIFLDRQWRGRVREQGKDEIKNPYDLVSLVDCMDARLRKIEPGCAHECGLVREPEPKQSDAEDLDDNTSAKRAKPAGDRGAGKKDRKTGPRAAGK